MGGDEPISAMEWKTKLAAMTDSATWDRLKSALSTETSRVNSLGSEAPRNAIRPAMPGG